MGKASRAKRDGTRREKIAAQRARERRAEIRNRLLIASGSVVVIIAIVAVFIVVKLNGKPAAAAASNGPVGTALASVVSSTTSVPASALDAVGAGSATSGPTSVNGAPLTQNGKPEVLYIGAEYCPYCAAQRWAMVVALSRFGTFSGLHTVHSSSTDTPANIPTWTFYKSSYTSKYVSFTPVETLTNVPDASSAAGYTALQSTTSAQQALMNRYDTQGSIPFVDMGNKYVQVGNPAGFGPQVLSGQSWSQIAAALDQPSSAIAKGVDGAANYMTAAICKLTNNQPASACTPVVKQLEAKL
jgi:Domain of unknown function (DUF929)